MKEEVCAAAILHVCAELFAKRATHLLMRKDNRSLATSSTSRLKWWSTSTRVASPPIASSSARGVLAPSSRHALLAQAQPQPLVLAPVPDPAAPTQRRVPVVAYSHSQSA
eukprot:scaffold56724_cov67-Phaeocystis_antarctica.AAC.2